MHYKITNKIAEYHLHIEKLLVTTQPGTEIKVTPLIDEPIIPKAIMYQGAFSLQDRKPYYLYF